MHEIAMVHGAAVRTTTGRHGIPIDVALFDAAMKSRGANTVPEVAGLLGIDVATVRRIRSKNIGAGISTLLALTRTVGIDEMHRICDFGVQVAA